ncbi:WhiB family transcriptional regulator [Streptomyces sp. 891-h]|uniref:WhiB family transcriptional regulator n=1 Tax=Streptomyces sp. 891-h TaxID=2720714 RepID=UPI001FAAB85C|nr:WhiB family transcriptional regulator [Streptomyces sp. 891-h]UNZ18168.1 WhiB family transcriptional regulator [Streptomyces sp. 891-h]
MSTDISSLIEAATQGDWSPLLRESEKSPGKHWAEDARCAGQDVEVFIPPGDGPHGDPQEVKKNIGSALNKPLNLCASCPVAVAARCLVDSLHHDDEFSIRAGLLAAERAELRAAWQQRVNEEAVSGALRGATGTLSAAEREEVVARFVAAPYLRPVTVARGLGVSREYLLKLARRYRKRSAPTSDSISGTAAA